MPSSSTVSSAVVQRHPSPPLGMVALSWLNLEFPSAVLLVPLTRFPGFVWMIAVALLGLPQRSGLLR
jgi:hypothetical protein